MESRALASYVGLLSCRSCCCLLGSNVHTAASTEVRILLFCPATAKDLSAEDDALQELQLQGLLQLPQQLAAQGSDGG